MKVPRTLVYLALLVGLASPALAGTITLDEPVPRDVSSADLGFNSASWGISPWPTLPATNNVSLTLAFSTKSLDLVITFGQPQGYVRLVDGNFGGSLANDNEEVYHSAFYASGNLIGIAAFSSLWTETNLKLISLSMTGIKHGTFTWTKYLGYSSRDNIDHVFSIPGTELLMVSGLLGLLGLRRKLRRG